MTWASASTSPFSSDWPHLAAAVGIPIMVVLLVVVIVEIVSKGLREMFGGGGA